MASRTHAGILFFSQIDNALSMMREAGINESRIAVIVQDIRSATLSEEYARLRNMIERSPPVHDSWWDMSRDLEERKEEAERIDYLVDSSRMGK